MKRKPKMSSELFFQYQELTETERQYVNDDSVTGTSLKFEASDTYVEMWHDAPKRAQLVADGWQFIRTPGPTIRVCKHRTPMREQNQKALREHVPYCELSAREKKFVKDSPKKIMPLIFLYRVTFWPSRKFLDRWEDPKRRPFLEAAGWYQLESSQIRKSLPKETADT